MQLRRIMSLLLIALVVAVQAASATTFNNPVEDKLSGKYEGIAKSDALGDLPLTVEIKNDNGKLSGKIDTPQGPAPITSGTFADGKITMKFDAGGNEGTVNAMLDGDKISGKWELAGQSGTLELKRVGATASAPKTEAAAPAAAVGDPISGDWEAAADAGGTTIPFTLKLKLEGDKVTGSSDSAQGSAPLSKGTFKDNKLSFSLDTPQGSITFTGMVKEGKVAGDFDFAGQMTGKWEAKKK
jgi:hypothetical protein